MIHQKGSLVFSSEKYSQKPITFDDMCLTVAIAYSIIYEGLYFNMNHKNIIMKVLELARNISKAYDSPNRYLISRYLLDIIH